MLQEILQQYLSLFPEDQESLNLLSDQIKNDEKLNDRRNFKGHITGSAIVLSPDRTQILLVHHKLFNRWQQPGGHWENDAEANPLQAAQREGEEETGIQMAEYVPVLAAEILVPLDIDSHQVPARAHKNEPIHWHHDFRYVFIAVTKSTKPQEAEVSAVKWFALDAPETTAVRPIVERLRRLNFVSV